jgi:hypothetical protein
MKKIMDKQRKQFLLERYRIAQKQQPEIAQLKRLLLKLGGEFIVPRPEGDRIINLLLKCGIVFHGPVLHKRMVRSACHQNVAAAWNAKKFGIVGIATGYALSDDGLWRQHTWGVLRDGILETTELREIYFGFLMLGPLADNFTKEVL